MATITDGFVAGCILYAGIRLCIAGFSKEGLPLNSRKRITDRPGRIVGILALLLSLVAAVAWLLFARVVG